MPVPVVAVFLLPAAEFRLVATLDLFLLVDKVYANTDETFRQDKFGKRKEKGKGTLCAHGLSSKERMKPGQGKKAKQN